MVRAAAMVAAAMILFAPYRPVAAQQNPAPPAASQPATAQDVAALRQTLERLRTEIAQLNRRVTAIEEELNAIKSR